MVVRSNVVTRHELSRSERAGQAFAFVSLADRDQQPIFVAVPTLRDSHSRDELLTWEPRTVNDPLVDASWCLDGFLILGDAEERTVQAFARRLGPMFEDQSQQQYSERREVSEPVQIWKAFANSLRSLLRIALEAPTGQLRGIAQFEAQLLPEILLDPRLETDYWDSVSVLARRLMGGEGMPFVTEDPMLFVRACTNDLLAIAGLRPDSAVGSTPGTGPTYMLPLRSPGERRLDSDAWPMVAVSLLPLLALQAVGAMRERRIFPCSSCQHPIPLRRGVKRPRIDQPFYGNHETCRRQAVLRSKRESHRRRVLHEDKVGGEEDVGASDTVLS